VCCKAQTQAQLVPWPAALGALPCDSGVPLTVLRGGPAAQLFCLATLPGPQQRAPAGGRESSYAGGDSGTAGEDCMVALSLR
jgi:hypothetical protein